MRNITNQDCPVNCSTVFKSDGTSVTSYRTVTGETWEVVHKASFDTSGNIQLLDDQPWMVSPEYVMERQCIKEEILSKFTMQDFGTAEYRQAELDVRNLFDGNNVPQECRVDITGTDRYKFVKEYNSLANKANAIRLSKMRVQ